MAVKYAVSRLTNSHIRKVGSGSSEQDLTVSRLTNSHIRKVGSGSSEQDLTGVVFILLMSVCSHKNRKATEQSWLNTVHVRLNGCLTTALGSIPRDGQAILVKSRVCVCFEINFSAVGV